MIIEALMDVGVFIVRAILEVLDVLPRMPNSIVVAVDDFVLLILRNARLVDFFFPISFGVSILTIVVVLANWKRVYHFILWIWHKVPISSE